VNNPITNYSLFSAAICVASKEGIDIELSESDARNLMNGDGSSEFGSDLANYLLLCKKNRQDYLDLTCDRVSST